LDWHATDADLLLAGESNGSVSAWRYSDRRRAFAVTAHADYVRAVQWSPFDKNTFLSAGDDGKVRVWKVEESGMKRLWECVTDSAVLCAAWHPTKRLIACGLRDDTLLLWKPGKDWSFSVRVHKGRIWDISWDPSGRHLVTAGNEGKIIVWQDVLTVINSRSRDSRDYIQISKELPMHFTCNELILDDNRNKDKNKY
jgi:WD40 repeat protein